MASVLCIPASVSLSLVEAEPRPKWWAGYMIQWNLSMKDTLNKGRLSNEGTVCSPNLIELCTNLPLNYRDTSLYRTASWVPVVSSIERLLY